MINLAYLQPAFAGMDKLWQAELIASCEQNLTGLDVKLAQVTTIHSVYPPQTQIFNALAHTPLDRVRVVILGQDPYHGVGEANGLAFSVNKGIAIPPSLRNIFKELELEYGNKINLDGEALINWADQGVLLLNSSLTVIKDQANSMANMGWQPITDKIIQIVNSKCSNVVFLLWGAFAQKKAEFIDKEKHLILTSSHPSPLSAYRGFLGCNHFKLANEYLLGHGHSEINWWE